jgi:hypothetical protein
MLDVHTFVKDKGGDPDIIRDSQKRRFHSVEVVDEVIALYDNWVKRMFDLHSILLCFTVLEKNSMTCVWLIIVLLTYRWSSVVDSRPRPSTSSDSSDSCNSLDSPNHLVHFVKWNRILPAR